MERRPDDIRILNCTFDPMSCLVEAWCDRCKRVHTHGFPTYRGRMPQPGEILGHRSAHCDSDGGSDGYELRFTGLTPPRGPTKRTTDCAKTPAVDLSVFS
jgi:hypothetical protein